MTNRRGIPPAVAEFAITERSQLLARIEEQDKEIAALAALAAHIAQRDAEIAELRRSIEGTPGYKYKAELYDEVWQAATGMGFSNVTMALAEITTLRARLAEPAAALEVDEVCVKKLDANNYCRILSARAEA